MFFPPKLIIIIEFYNVILKCTFAGIFYIADVPIIIVSSMSIVKKQTIQYDVIMLTEYCKYK